MGFLSWLGISPRDAPALPEITDNVRDSGQTFVFGRADSGERVDEKSAMQIATVYACVTVWNGIKTTARLTIGEEQVTITDNDSFIDLDCELEDAFRDTVNLNGCLELSSGDFPILPPGSTSITFGSGITKVELIPRWWCL